MEDLNSQLAPGMLVRHPEKPEWGVGQVQTNIPGRITVMFEDAGKVVVNSNLVALDLVVEP